MHKFSIKKIHLKVSSAKCHIFSQASIYLLWFTIVIFHCIVLIAITNIVSVKHYSSGTSWKQQNAINHMVAQTFSQSPYLVLMTSHICLPLGLCKETVNGLWKTVEISTGHMGSQCIATWGNPNLYLDWPITKVWCHSIGFGDYTGLLWWK